MTAYLLLGCRALVCVVFAVAFAGKARSADRFQRFVTSVRELAVLPGRAATPAAAAIVVGEAMTAVLLALPLAPRAGFALGALLLVVFIGVAIRAVQAGVLAECRCFGSRGAVMGQAMIVRNLLLLGCALPGAVAGAAVLPGRPVATAVPLAAGALVAWGFLRWYDRLVARLMKRLLAPARSR